MSRPKTAHKWLEETCKAHGLDPDALFTFKHCLEFNHGTRNTCPCAVSHAATHAATHAVTHAVTHACINSPHARIDDDQVPHLMPCVCVCVFFWGSLEETSIHADVLISNCNTIYLCRGCPVSWAQRVRITARKPTNTTTPPQPGHLASHHHLATVMLVSRCGNARRFWQACTTTPTSPHHHGSTVATEVLRFRAACIPTTTRPRHCHCRTLVPDTIPTTTKESTQDHTIPGPTASRSSRRSRARAPSPKPCGRSSCLSLASLSGTSFAERALARRSLSFLACCPAC